MSYQNFDKLNETRHKVDELKGVMHKNIEIVIDRGQRIEDLEQKAEDLEHGASKFKDNSTALKRKMRCQYWRNVALIVLLILIILGSLIGIIYASHN